MVPYLCFSVLSILAFAVLGKLASGGLGIETESNSILPNLAGMLYGNGTSGYMRWNLPLWFLPCFFVAQMVFYGVLKIWGKYRVAGYGWLGCITVVVFLVLGWMNYHVLH